MLTWKIRAIALQDATAGVLVFPHQQPRAITRGTWSKQQQLRASSEDPSSIRAPRPVLPKVESAPRMAKVLVQDDEGH